MDFRDPLHNLAASWQKMSKKLLFGYLPIENDMNSVGRFRLIRLKLYLAGESPIRIVNALYQSLQRRGYYVGRV